MQMSIADPLKHIRNLLEIGQLEEAVELLNAWMPHTSAFRNDLTSLEKQINPKERPLSDTEKRAWISRVFNLLRRCQSDPQALIEIAIRSNARFLDLGRCSLNALPEQITQLQNLEELNLGSVYWDDDLRKFSGTRNDGAPNDFSNEDFGVLQKLHNLRKLTIRGCKINTLEHLAELTQLETLSIGQNQLSDVGPLRKMTQLQVLSLFNNKIKHIEPLSALRNLSMLSLNNNLVHEITPLTELKRLRALHLVGNRLESIHALAGLSELEELNLSDNHIEGILPIAGLSALKSLNLSGNPIKDCPPEIAFSGDSALIRAYFQASTPQSKLILTGSSIASGQWSATGIQSPRIPKVATNIPTLEVKLILVGNSSAGKTSVTKLLRKIAHDKREETTHGIQVSEWLVDAKEIAGLRSPAFSEYQMKVNIWDFGGQEYYHETHRIFLDSNAVYLLVWDQSTNLNQQYNTTLYVEGDAQAFQLEHFHFQYWLDNIRFHTSAASPPVILLENKIDLNGGQSHWHDRQMLLNYKILRTASISARYAGEKAARYKRYRYGFEIFREDLLGVLVEKAEANANIANLPTHWVNIRDSIRNFQRAPDSENPFRKNAGAAPWINTVDFDKTCKKLGDGMCEEAAIQLKKYLHQTGTIIWLPEIDSARVYLNPSQLTANMYQVLNKKVRQQNGIFQKADITSAFENPDEASKMLQVMQSWELVFPHPTFPQTWLAPQYLPEQHAMENLFNIALTGLQENYMLFRGPIFHIRRMMRHLAIRFSSNKSVEASEYWKYGMLFAVSRAHEKIRIFVKSLSEQSNSAFGQLMLCVEPEKSLTEFWKEWLVREILNSFVRSELGRDQELGQSGILLREIALKQHELSISLDGRQFVAVARLVKDADSGFSAAITLDGGRLPMKHFGALLRATEIEPPTPSIFISYAHADTTFRQALEIHLEPMQRLGIAMHWSDVQITPGQAWNEAILGQMRGADIVVLLVSPNFLSSEYIWKTEIPEALNRNAQGRCTIIPVLVRPCDWEDMPFAKIEMAPKYPPTNKLLAISRWPDEDEALNAVVLAIKVALQEMSI